MTTEPDPKSRIVSFTDKILLLSCLPAYMAEELNSTISCYQAPDVFHNITDNVNEILTDLEKRAI